MAKTAQPISDKQWEAQSDAETLASGAAIRADKPRLARAAKAAQKLSKDAQVKATAMKRVAAKGKRSKR